MSCNLSCIDGAESNARDVKQGEIFEIYPEIKGYNGINKMSNYSYIKYLNSKTNEYPLVYLYVGHDLDSYLSINKLSKFTNVEVSASQFYLVLEGTGSQSIIDTENIKLYVKKSLNSSNYYMWKEKDFTYMSHEIKNHSKNCHNECYELIFKLIRDARI